MHSILAGKTLSFEKSVGRIGALAVALGVGVGLGATMACGVAYADGPTSSSGQSSHTNSTGNAAGRSSTAKSGQSPAHARGREAGASEQKSRESSRESGDRASRSGGGNGTVRAGGASASSTAADQEASGDQPAAATQPTGLQRPSPRQRGVAGEAKPVQIVAELATGSDPSAPVATAAVTVSLPSSSRAIGIPLVSLLGGGSPAGDPLSSPTDAVLLAGVRREFGGRGRGSQAAASARVVSQVEENQPVTLSANSAAKTLSALASPRAAASPLESFIGAIGTFINTAVKSITGALTSAFNAVNNAITTLLRAVGLAPKKTNHAPSVVDDGGLTTAEDTPVSITAATLLGNDSDVDGGTLTVSGVSTPAHGTAVLSGTTVTYTPGLNYSGADSFTYTVSDGQGGTATGTVAVTVTAVNDSPVAVGNTVSTTEGTPVSITAATLLGNDSDLDGDTLTVTEISQAQHGSVQLAGTTVTYTPVADFSGADSFTYTISDGHGGTATGTVAVTVTGVNDAPVAVGNTASTAEDTPVSISAATLLGNDSDPDGDTLTVTGISQPEHGSAVLNGATVTYTPDDDFNGVDSLTYTISDGHGGSATGTVTVTVTPVNDAPTAANDLAATKPNTPVTINVLDNDTDVDGDLLSVAVAGAPAHGSVVANEDGSVTYTPAANYTGTDSFGYTISDGTTTVSATVTVTVTAQQPLTLDSFYDPQIHVTPSGDVYVFGKAFVPLDDGSGQGYDYNLVGHLNEDGTITTVADLKDIVPTPYSDDVAIGPDGRVYVLDTGWYGSDGTLTVYKADGTSHVILQSGDLSEYQVDLQDSISGLAVHLAVGNDGKIYLTAWTGRDEDAVPSALIVLNPDGTVAVAPVDLGFGYAGVKDLVIGVDGRAYVLGTDLSSYTDSLVIIDLGGSSTRIALGDVGATSLAVAAGGTIYVGRNGGVIAVNATGPFGSLPDLSGAAVTDVAVGPDGLYAVADGNLSLVDPTHIDLETAVVDSLDDFLSIAGVTVGSGGQQYVAGSVNAFGATTTRLARVNADGSVSDLGPITLNNFGSIAAGPGGIVYIAGPNGIAKLDTATGATHLIPVGYPVAQVAVGANGSIYFTGGRYNPDTNSPADYVSVIDPDGNILVAPVVIGDRYTNPVTGLAVGADGRIYLTSYLNGTNAGALTILGADGTVAKTISLTGGRPSGVAVSTEGIAYVISSTRVIAVDPNGAIETVKTGWAITSLPTSIAMGPDGLLNVVVMNYAQGTSSISVLDPTNVVDDSAATDLSEFYGLYGIAVGSAGQKYVLGYNYGANGLSHSKLVRVGADGKSVTQLVDFGPGSAAIDIEIGSDGRFYVTDNLHGTVTAYDPAHAFAAQLIQEVPSATGLAIGNGRIYVSSVTTSTDTPQTGVLTVLNGDGSVFASVDLDAAALGVSVGPDGRVYVVTASSSGGTNIDGTLLIFSATGVLKKTVPLPGRAAYNVTVGPNGTAYVADLSGHVVAVGQDGSVSDLASATFPFGLDFGPDGKLYVTSAISPTANGPTITALDPATSM